MKPETLMIDDVKYVRADTTKPAPTIAGLEAVLVRTKSAGAHFGYLQKREGTEVTLVNARRVFYWDGAASFVSNGN